MLKGDQRTIGNKDGLSLREQLFCVHYLLTKCSNGGRAAAAAGYKGDVKTRASQLLRRPRIVRVIERERQRLMDKFEITKERVLRELARIAFLDVRTLFDADGSLTKINELDADTASAIAGVDYKSGGVIKIRFASKLGALDLLGRWLKLWDGAGGSGKDRLDELVQAMRRGPVENNEDDDKIPLIQ